MNKKLFEKPTSIDKNTQEYLQNIKAQKTRRFRSSAGGFSDDLIWPEVEMHRHNYREKNDPVLLINIIKAIEPLLEKDISEAIIKYIEAGGARSYGFNKAKVDELIIEQYQIMKNDESSRSAKEIQEILAERFKRNNAENIRKLLEREGILPKKTLR